jgi:prepilin-type N-terminal cleavage/methylation domain-containing protein
MDSSGRSSKGFTLIELLVVIAIIGLLASIILASLNTARQKGRDARRVADTKEIQLALELYYDANSQYPTTLAALAPVYISALPTDPSSSATCTTGAEAGCYAYAGLQGAASTAATCGAYHLGASLEVNDPSTLSSAAQGTLNGTYGVGKADGAICQGTSQTPANSGADFAGSINAVCKSGDAGTHCYDLKP